MFKNCIINIISIFYGFLSAQTSLTELTKFIEKELEFEKIILRSSKAILNLTSERTVGWKSYL